MPCNTVAEKSVNEEEMGSISSCCDPSLFQQPLPKGVASASGSSGHSKGVFVESLESGEPSHHSSWLQALFGAPGSGWVSPPLPAPFCCVFITQVPLNPEDVHELTAPFPQQSQGCLCCLDSPWLPVPLYRSHLLLVLACLTFWLRLFFLPFVDTEAFICPPRLLPSPKQEKYQLAWTLHNSYLPNQDLPKPRTYSVFRYHYDKAFLSFFIDLSFLCSFFPFFLSSFLLSFFPCLAFFLSLLLSINTYLSFSFIVFFISSIIYLSASNVFIYNSSLPFCLAITYLSLSSAVCLAVSVIYVFLSVNICPCHRVSVYCLSLSPSFICLISIYILFIFSCPSLCLTPSPCAYHSHSIFISLTPVISYFMVSFCPFISFQGLSNFFFCFSVSRSLI